LKFSVFKKEKSARLSLLQRVPFLNQQARGDALVSTLHSAGAGSGEPKRRRKQKQKQRRLQSSIDGQIDGFFFCRRRIVVDLWCVAWSFLR